tara:strand:+ start:553 stop:1281 length:729 start_codon:yes stop_codon:yes gene_type:complete
MSEDKKCAADNTKIAGEKTISDWKKLRENLLPDKEFNEEDWEKAFDDYFIQRLETRYFRPIQELDKIKENTGEGFSIVTIYCSLIEFLQSMREGKIYKYAEKDEKIEDPYYSDAGDMFKRFLITQKPIEKWIKSGKNDCNKYAQDFYKNVRCALIHEARTKGNWKILVSTKHEKEYSNLPIDFGNTKIFRDKLCGAFNEYLANYRREILNKSRQNLRIAFIIKFDNLADLPIDGKLITQSGS